MNKEKNVVPIVFAFGNDWILPACVCLSSLLQNAKPTTFYDIFILHSPDEELEKDDLEKLERAYSNFRIQYRAVERVFEKSYEIRGIKTMAYYRLLIPELIPEYDVILYSDVDVIFRSDLYEVYALTDLTNCYVAGVDSLSHFDTDVKKYYEKNLGVSSEGIIYSGNLIINSRKIRDERIVNRFKEHARKEYRFQDMDILNLVCKGHVKFVDPMFCVTTYFVDYALYRRKDLNAFWSDKIIDYALQYGIVHYNGQKPWKGYCVNFDIWWEYYRKSPIFDEKFYFDFFYNRLNEYDLLPLWKRIKILIRYFVYGRKTVQYVKSFCHSSNLQS